MQLHELINHIGNKYNVSNEYKSGMEILLRDLDDKNMTTAVGIFVKAALSGESAAQYVLSRLLSQGAGAEKYQDKVLEYLKKAADGGILEAQYDYAIAHIFGGHNIKLAEARLNNLWAEYPYLYVKPKNEKLSTGPVTKNDFVSSKDGPPISPPSWPDDFENQKKTIVSGERLLYLKALPLDQITMPIRRTGTFRVPNYDKTHLYFQKALREKFDPIVGMNYLKGAAEAGLASAGTLFGNYLLHCQDERLKGISFLEKSVEKDDPEALIAYGALYWEGLFYKRDYAKAIPYFQRAADQGDVEAYVVLIVLERQVYGGPKDKEKAEQFISDLSQLGWPIGNKMKKLLKRKTKFTERRSRNMKATIRYDYD